MEPAPYTVAVPYRIEPAESARACEAYVLTSERRRFYIGALTADILNGLRAQRPLSAIADDLGRRAEGITLDRVREVIETQLVPLGLVVAHGETPVASSSHSRRYVKASSTIIPPSVVERIVAPLAPLCGAATTAVLFALSLMAYVPYVGRFGAKVLLPWAYVGAIGRFRLVDFAVFYALLVGSILWHELGHATAAARHGVRLGAIGFGLYLLFPVFFTDVSEAWKAGKYKRLAINLGGVYFQSLANAVLIAVALLRDSEVVQYAILVNAFAMVYALNPFLRFDGYWVISDLFELHGLRARSLQFGRDLLAARWAGRFRLIGQNGFLASYGLLCAAFFAFLAFVYVRLLVRVVTVPSSLAGGITHWLLLAYIIVKTVVPAVRRRVNRSAEA